jgi:hypothetical protein
LAQRNLNFLVEAAIEREEPVVKKRTHAVKKTIPSKEKHLSLIEGISLAIRSNASLMK